MLAAQAALLHCCGLQDVWNPLRRNGPSSLRRDSRDSRCSGVSPS